MTAMSDPKLDSPETGPEDLGDEAGARAMDAALRSSFVILKCVIAILVVFLVFSNTFTVEDQKEGAIILRFGQSRTDPGDIWKPGIRFAWPYPIEEKVKLEKESPVTTDFAWTQYPPRDLANPDIDPDSLPRINAGDPTHGYLLTKDNKVLHLHRVTLSYAIEDPDQFVFGFHDAEAVLRTILESAATHAAHERTLEEITSPGKIPKGGDEKTFKQKVKARVERLLKQYGLGVKLVGDITLDFGKPQEKEFIPSFARKSWHDYVEQSVQSQRTIARARNEAADLRRFTGELADIEREAETERKALLSSLEAIAKRFEGIYKNYPKPPARQRVMKKMYYETLTRIAQNPDVKIYLVTKGNQGKPTRIKLKINQARPQPHQE
jgi:regulator of protease activity HflC (stomatin/prohibitin superfamily)